VGLELNHRSARAILEDSVAEINAVRGDALMLPFADNAFDYAICSLFTHHFTDPQVIGILRELSRVAAGRIFVIDLHRHPVAYYFYTTVGKLFLRNRLIREDGALSILRSFKPKELHELAERAGLKEIELRRSFPYRLVLSGKKKQSRGAQELAKETTTRVRLAS
jgi:ubiquinone/menaquinone biosynthesis C-methylase UbiE